MLRKSIRAISVVVLGFFLWTCAGLFQVAYAAMNAAETPGNERYREKGQDPGERLEAILGKMREALSDPRLDAETKKRMLVSAKGELETLDKTIRTQFADTEIRLKEARVSEEILQRHYRFARHYEDNFLELVANLDLIEKAKTKDEADAWIRKAAAHLERVKPPVRHTPLDPKKLPHRVQEPVFKEPRTKPEEFRPNTQRAWNSRRPKPVRVASNGPDRDILALSLPSTGSSTSLQVAQADLPTDADLAETIEVRFTPEIRAKAAELGHNPVRIYNWVRNTIEFVPTYGSIQGAAMTLETRQGNAFDTASLLIALLRASGIHARYVQGTIDVPVEKVMNWVGGFTDSKSAVNLIAGGGVPVTSLVAGGKIAAVRMEHVWVETWVDYIPSRGARHKAGQGDAWISLDASFKQYDFRQGADLETAVPFDPQSLIEGVKATAIINEAEGYATSLGSMALQQEIQKYQTRLEDFIALHGDDNATVGYFLGQKTIVKQEFPFLLGTLPYKVVTAGSRMSQMSEYLRFKVAFAIQADVFDEGTGSSIYVLKNLPEISGKRVTLSFVPATQADEDALRSLMPKPHADGTPIQPSELPMTFPAYIVHVRSELRIDGELAATGPEAGLGEDRTFSIEFLGPNAGVQSEIVTNTVTAGGYYGVAIDAGGISNTQLQRLKSDLEAVKAKWEAKDYSSLDKDNTIGNVLYSNALYYYAELDAINQMQSRVLDVVVVRLPSESIFSYELKVSYLYGVPKEVTAGGLLMDVDRNVNAVGSVNGDKEKVTQFMNISGMNSSALEHSVPERLFNNPDNPVEGISAVKILQLANDQGIPIYTVNGANMETVLPKLQLDPVVIADIRNAVNSGETVTVPMRNISFSGWSGCGYIALDPQTGSGAYRISGGMNGAWIPLIIMWTGLILLSWFPALMTLLLALALGEAVFSAAVVIVPILIALVYGAGLSQIFDAEMKLIAQTFLKAFIAAILMGKLPVLLMAFGPWGLWILLALIVIAHILPISGENEWKRNRYLCNSPYRCSTCS